MKANKYFLTFKDLIDGLDYQKIDEAVDAIRSTWLNGGKIITMGNGGSALTASHFINDWNKSIFLATGKSFKGYSLTDNVGLLMSYANDISYQDIFLEQLKNILEPHDLVIGISGSGNSENVLRAIKYSRGKGVVTIGLCGYDGGKLKDMVNIPVWVNKQDMQFSEDVHFMFGHIVMKSLCGEESI
jgi:D-sedoheptulose 7-phosphate isomerase